jgi:hypothetical protein
MNRVVASVVSAILFGCMTVGCSAPEIAKSNAPTASQRLLAATPTIPATPVPSPTRIPVVTLSPPPSIPPTPTPLPVVTPKPPPNSASVSDRAGDLHDTDSGSRTTAPKYVDVRNMALRADGTDLFLRLDLAGDPPADLDALYTTVGYYFLIDTGNDGQWDFEVDLSSTDDWSATLFSIGEAYSYSGPNFPGSSVTEDTFVLIRIGLDKIGSPSVLRIQGLVQYEDYPDPVGDPLTSNAAEDRVPDDDAKWITLGTGA